MKVLSVLDGGKVLVDATGRFRVVVDSTGEVIEELMTESDASAFAGGFNTSGGETVKVVPYSKSCPTCAQSPQAQ